MDTKAIVEKALKGEDYSQEVKSFTEEQKTQLSIAIKDAANAEAVKALEKVAALRKENQRIEESGKKEETDFLTRFSKEQLQKAKNQFFSDPKFQLTEKEKQEFEQTFKSEKLDADLILSDMKKHFAWIKSDELLASKEKAVELEKNAKNFMEGQVNFQVPISAPDADKYSKATKDLYMELKKKGFNHSLDAVQKLIDKGENWKISDLSK